MEQIEHDQNFKYFDIITAIFAVVLVLSNFASSAKIIDWGVSLGNVRMAFDAGTVFFPFAYIFGDVLTEVYGFARSRRVIWLGFGALLFSFLMFLLIRVLPGEANWQQTVGQPAFDSILGGVSTGGIVLASILGYLFGSFSNAVVMALMKTFTKGKLLWLRTISSTILGEFVDSIIFVAIATLTGVFPRELFWSLTLTNYIFKVLIEVLFTPVTYQVVRKLKQAEGVDIYSDLTDLSPLGF